VYRCEICETVTAPREPQKSIVTQTRKKEYTNRVEGEVIVSQGTEIVKEMKVCQECYDESPLTLPDATPGFLAHKA